MWYLFGSDHERVHLPFRGRPTRIRTGLQQRLHLLQRARTRRLHQQRVFCTTHSLDSVHSLHAHHIKARANALVLIFYSILITSAIPIKIVYAYSGQNMSRNFLFESGQKSRKKKKLWSKFRSEKRNSGQKFLIFSPFFWPDSK